MAHPFEYLQKRQDLRDCCRNMLNLDVKQTDDDCSLRARCRKCGRGHVKMVAKGFQFRRLLSSIGEMEVRPSGLMVPK